MALKCTKTAFPHILSKIRMSQTVRTEEDEGHKLLYIYFFIIRFFCFYNSNSVNSDF